MFFSNPRCEAGGWDWLFSLSSHASRGAGGAQSKLPAAPATVFQNATIDALLDGNYSGELTFEQLRQHGNFGLGTFDALDGEMVALEGHFYQIRSNGSVYDVPGAARTPFAVVSFFRPTDTGLRLDGPLSYGELQRRLDALRSCDNHAFAFAVEGSFDLVRARSVPRQAEPYAPLAEVVKTQAVFELKRVRGTLVGFWFPESLRHLNVPGYHFHFLTGDRSAGGHVLDLKMASGTARVQELSVVELALPKRAPTTRAATSNQSVELRKVEQ